jgi:outer membrane protein OmpA-like peptidoglycan-associated protein
MIATPTILPPPPPPPLLPPTSGSGRPNAVGGATPGNLAAPPPAPPVLASPPTAANGHGTAAPAAPPRRPQLAQTDPAAGSTVASTAPYPASAAQRSELVGTILFKHGSAWLSAADKRLLGQIAMLHRQYGGGVRVVGHSSGRTREVDPVRHHMINFEASLKRANVVADELRRLGVGAERIVVEAKSNSEPKFYEWAPSGEAGNRRADIFFDY